MWICTNKGFISAVEADASGVTLKVRARNRKHLEELFPGRQIHEDPLADYRYRTFIPKAIFAEWVKEQALKIDYSNFKDSVRDPKLHDLYADFWSLHYRYQHNHQNRRKERPLRAGTSIPAGEALAKAFGKRGTGGTND